MQKYGLIGFPLGHSFSRNFFNKKFETENIDAQYLTFEIPTIGAFKQVIKDNPELNGLNVTFLTNNKLSLYWMVWMKMQGR